MPKTFSVFWTQTAMVTWIVGLPMRETLKLFNLGPTGPRGTLSYCEIEWNRCFEQNQSTEVTEVTEAFNNRLTKTCSQLSLPQLTLGWPRLRILAGEAWLGVLRVKLFLPRRQIWIAWGLCSETNRMRGYRMRGFQNDRFRQQLCGKELQVVQFCCGNMTNEPSEQGFVAWFGAMSSKQSVAALVFYYGPLQSYQAAL